MVRIQRPARPIAKAETAFARTKKEWASLAVLWLTGISLRLTILAVPPLLPDIHRTLGLSEELVGALSGLPVLLLALGSVPGAFVISRLGARRCLLLGLSMTCIAGAARGVLSSTLVLFSMTFVMAMGIAISQPALPSLVRSWFSGHSGFATAVYSNGFLIGEIVAAALTVPLVLPLAGGSWERAFAVWSVPIVVTVTGLAVLRPEEGVQLTDGPGRWWPDWRSGRTWRLGLIFGCGSIAYFGSNAFLPDYLKATHHSALIAPALASLNICQLPSSVLVAAMPGRLIGRRWAVATAGAAILVSTAGFAAVEPLIVVWSGLLGFSSAMVFVLSLALPPLLANTGDVPRLSAAMFTLSYALAAVGSLLGGVVWDATRVPLTAFAPIFAAAILMMALSAGLRVESRKVEVRS
ncbi:MAG: MFS transporter [Chloroflexota bacterium]